MLRYFLIFTLLAFQTLTKVSYADISFVERPDVQQFIQKMVKKHHFKKESLTTLFSQVRLRQQVIRHIKKPLEKETWDTYQVLFVNDWRIKHGVEFWNQYADVLKKAEKVYGVPASIIVATIGIETKYGQRTGDFRVIDSLSNLAFNHTPRANFFRRELEEFLLLVREQKLNPLTIMGSYAGAIGQPQFMPSSYRYYAVNFSNSGKIDLMNNEVDVIGSIANYYKKHGWATSMPIANPSIIIGSRYHYLKSKIDFPITVADLSKYGILFRQKAGNESLKVNIIELQNHYTKEYWLGFHNFNVIKRYNSSDLYAMAVYQLSNHISALRERLNNG